MRSKFVKKASAILVVVLMSTTSSMATDGYFSLGYGTQSKGLAGAGVALYTTSLIGGNPAGNVWLGKQFAFGVSVFSPSREYSVSGDPSGDDGTFSLTPGTVQSDKPVFFIPSIGGNLELGESSAFGFSIYGNGGMNTEYPTETFYGTNPTGINLSQLFTDLTFSFKLGENHSLGISAIGGFQMFEATGLAAFSGFSTDPTKLTDNGIDYSYGFGFKVGYIGQITEKLSIGLKYQSKMMMSEFTEYAGLFAESGDFDVPSVWTAGIAYAADREWTIVADVKRINYTDVKSVSNPIKNLTTELEGALGASNGAGFGWKEMMIYKLGLEYAPYRSDWTYRIGASYGKNPIPESEMMFNILAPGVSESHITAGFSRKLDRKKGNAVHLAAMFSPTGSVKGSNIFDKVQIIELSMSQLELELSYSF